MSPSKGIVYLAGGIAGLSGEDASTWRENAEAYFLNKQIKVRNPMRGKILLHNAMSISNNYNDYKTSGPFYTSKGIITRDFNDVKQSDVLLVNLLGAPKPSLGTIMELAWAYALQKPVVAVIEPEGNPHDNHPMIHEAMGFRVADLWEGLYAVNVILGGH